MESMNRRAPTKDMDVSGGETDAGAGMKAVRDMLYGVENLRKRPGAED